MFRLLWGLLVANQAALTPLWKGSSMWFRFLLTAALCGVPNIASAQSFDCAKAQTRVEKMVCADRAIAELDEYLGRYYAAARAEVPGAGACLQSDQAQWGPWMQHNMLRNILCCVIVTACP